MAVKLSKVVLGALFASVWVSPQSFAENPANSLQYTPNAMGVRPRPVIAEPKLSPEQRVTRSLDDVKKTLPRVPIIPKNNPLALSADNICKMDDMTQMQLFPKAISYRSAIASKLTDAIIMCETAKAGIGRGMINMAPPKPNMSDEDFAKWKNEQSEKIMGSYLDYARQLFYDLTDADSVVLMTGEAANYRGQNNDTSAIAPKYFDQMNKLEAGVKNAGYTTPLEMTGNNIAL